MKAVLLDWRVATLVILVLLSVIIIYRILTRTGTLLEPPYGLDLQQGAWIHWK